MRGDNVENLWGCRARKAGGDYFVGSLLQEAEISEQADKLVPVQIRFSLLPCADSGRNVKN